MTDSMLFVFRQHCPCTDFVVDNEIDYGHVGPKKIKALQPHMHVTAVAESRECLMGRDVHRGPMKVRFFEEEPGGFVEGVAMIEDCDDSRSVYERDIVTDRSSEPELP